MIESALRALLDEIGATDATPLGEEAIVTPPVEGGASQGAATFELSVIARGGAPDRPEEVVLPESVRGRFRASYYPDSNVLEWTGVPLQPLSVAGDPRHVSLAAFEGFDDPSSVAYVRLSEPGARAIIHGGTVAIWMDLEPDGWHMQLLELSNAPPLGDVRQWLARECADEPLREALAAGLHEDPWARLGTAALLIATAPARLTGPAASAQDWLRSVQPGAPATLAWFRQRPANVIARIIQLASSRAKTTESELAAVPTALWHSDEREWSARWKALRRFRAEVAALSMVLSVHCGASVAELDDLARAIDERVLRSQPERAGFDLPIDEVLAACWPLAPDAWWVDAP